MESREEIKKELEQLQFFIDNKQEFVPSFIKKLENRISKLKSSLHK